MDTERAKALFIELRDHLRKQNCRDLDIQAGNAAKTVQYLEAVSSEEEKEEIIKTYFRILYPGGRGGLSDVVLWDEDYDTRVALNEPIDRIRKELWEVSHE